MRSVVQRLSGVVALAVAVSPAPAFAQTADSVRARPPVETAAIARPRQTRLTPPITPRRAFLLSLMLPGLGQSKLERGTAGAMFSSIELASLVMVRRSQSNVREAQRYRLDTLPAEFTVSSGLFRSSGSFTNKFTSDLVRTRRLHVEDWLAVVAFNHLFAAADAFVAAQLWDVPVTLSARPRVDGALVVATLHW
jgi:hypothetical protein